MKTGIVKWFSRRKSYGFISEDEGGDFFVHQNDIIADGYRFLEEGDRVQFKAEATAKGLKAISVVKI